MARPLRKEPTIQGATIRYRLALVAVSYYAAVELGFALTPAGLPLSLLWPANSLLLATLLLTPTRHWWLVLLAVLPAHLAAELQRGVPVLMVLAWFASNCGEALIGAGAVRLLLGEGARFFDSFRNASVLLACAALLAPLLSSFFDAGFVQLIGWTNGSGYWELVRVRATSNTFAALSVGPLLLTWAEGRDGLKRPRARRLVEVGLVFLGLALVAAAVFQLQPGTPEYPALFYAPLPFMLWAAVRFGPIGVTTANILLTAIALWGALKGFGPFVGGSPEENARQVQYFLAAATVPLLLVAVLLQERRRVELERREQRQQLMHLSRVATLGGLSGALAHELNQPLTSILSNAQAAQRMLAASALDVAELADIMKDIVTADRRASEVIGRLRALFKDGDPRLQSLAVNELVREVLELMHGDLAMHQVNAVTELDPREPMVRSDRVQLEQVLLNLAMNACEAMNRTAPEARMLCVRTSADGGGGVRISLVDRGPGFVAGELDKVFRPFYSTKPKGLGLGLSISSAIVSAHGGRLWAEAAPEGGAVFHVELPGEARSPGVGPWSNSGARSLAA